MSRRLQARDLVDLTTALFLAAGLDRDKASTTAALLVEADLIGHTTHGSALVPAYLKEIAEGRLRTTGQPEVVTDRPAVLVWDGRHLPGVWLAAAAVDQAVQRAIVCGTASVAVRRSGHIGCLAAFLERATSRGIMVMICSSDPAVATVAPHGGRVPLFTPDPIAIGIPTDGDPILIDTSASITTNGFSARLAAEGRSWSHTWWLDAAGRPTTDSSVVTTEPPGTILPTGGVDHGHKGYALALLIESLSQALPGFGRADRPTSWGASFFVQAWDPELFTDRQAFLRQTSWLAAACRGNPPRPGVERVRVPGDQAAACKLRALAEGIELYPGILEALSREAARLGVPLPASIAG